jgi:hypothetical protein
MIIHCPICNAEASSLPRTGLANGFDCPNHGRFKVSDTVLAMPAFTEAPRAQWEAALAKAKASPQADEWAPCITSYHF